jgi:hypothetical protein
MIDSGDYWLTRSDYSIAPTSGIMDEEIDEILDRE